MSKKIVTTRKPDVTAQVAAFNGAKAKNVPTPAEPAKDAAAPVDAKKPATKKAKGDELTISDVARELKMSPKIARGKLRKAGMKAKEGRWPLMKRDSAEHKRIVATLTAVVE